MLFLIKYQFCLEAGLGLMKPCVYLVSAEQHEKEDYNSLK